MLTELYKIDENGLQTPSITDVRDWLVAQMKSIYGDDTDFDKQNSPDAQLVNIFAQVIADVNELAKYIYNARDINTAEGRNLDVLVALNGIRRNNGSFTIVPITIRINQNVSLAGLDNDINSSNGTGFTISDNQGNQYILTESVTLAYEAGIHEEYVLNFRAKSKGEIVPILESINNIMMPTLGVVSVNNLSAPTNIGEEEESDYNLRNRFFNTYDNAGQGGYNQIVAKIYALNGVKSVGGENNYTASTSQYGTPAHSIWLIVDGGSKEEIGEILYSMINTGCGMRGEEVVSVTDEYGNIFEARFDRPQLQDLYLKFNAEKKEMTYEINTDEIKEKLIENLKLMINTPVNVSDIDCLLTNLNDNLVYSNIQVSTDNTTWYNIVENTNLNYLFKLEADNITIIVGN